MTLEEILLSQGLSAEQVEKVVGEMKQNKIFTAGEENMDIRYKKLQDDYNNLNAQHGESSKLIEQLKKGTKDSEELQGKISDYEGRMTALQTEYDERVKQLEAELAETQLNNAIQLALRDAKAADTDYLAFKMREKYKDGLVLGEDGKIKDIGDKIAGLKVQFPTQFGDSQQNHRVEPQKLPEGNGNKVEPETLADAIKAKYEAN
jgi:seryl-tRNA synthetase